VLLYLLGWLVIAKEGRDDTSAMRALRGSPEGNRALLFLVLAIGVVLILASPLVWFDGFGLGDGLALPLLLIAAGVAFLIWPDDDRRRDRRAAQAQRNPDDSIDDGAMSDDWDSMEPALDPEIGEPMSTGDEIRFELRAARDEVRSELTEARDSFRQQRREWRHGYRAERREQRMARPAPPPKPAPFVGPLTVAVLLVFAGVSMVGEQSDWWDVDPAIYGGLTLAIIGLGLTASAWFGRARGLIFLGLAVLPIAWAIAAVDLEWHDGVGEQTDTVASLADLQDSYTFGIGDYVVDLSAVELDGTDRTIEVGLTIGELTIWVPEDMNVVVDADGRIGELEVRTTERTDFGLRVDSQFDDGIDIDVDHRYEADTDGTLTIDADLGIGAFRIQQCTPDRLGDTEGVTVSCP
jgi:hypothetical protein